MTCRHQNLVTEAANTASLAVSVSRHVPNQQPLQGPAGLQLNLTSSTSPAQPHQLNLTSIQIPLVTGYIDIGPVIVSMDQQDQHWGSYALVTSANSRTSIDITTGFELIEAFGLTNAVKDAMAAIDTANEEVRLRRVAVSEKQHQEGRLRESHAERLQAAQSHLSHVPGLCVIPLDRSSSSITAPSQ